MQHDCVAWRLPICAACVQVPSDSNFINFLLASDKCTQRRRTLWQIMPVRKYAASEKIMAGGIIPGVLFHIRMLVKKCLVAIRERLDDETNSTPALHLGGPCFMFYPRHQLT